VGLSHYSQNASIDTSVIAFHCDFGGRDFFDVGGKIKGHILKDSGLVMIPPEEKYSFTQAFNIPVSQSVFPNRATLSKIHRIHTIWLSIGIFTWPYNLERVEKSLGRKIRKKWRKTGDLILKPLVAKPVCLGNPNEWPIKRSK
jgi:hypothetical protein